MEKQVFRCPICDTQVDIDDIDVYKDGYTQYRDYYVECPKCNLSSVIETINNKVKYPVHYYKVDKDNIVTTITYHDPKIDKYI